MPGIESFAVFVVAGLLMNITPGPDTMYILGRSIAQGRRAGVASALGISSGSILHTIAAGLGLSTILAASRLAFEVVKYAGGTYLAYLGLRMLVERTRLDGTTDIGLSGEGAWTIYRQGVITNVLNPKVALFFLSFLPQFIAPSARTSVVPFLFLGFVFTFNGTIWCLVLVMFASTLAGPIRGNAGAANVVKKATGMLFIGLAINLIVCS